MVLFETIGLSDLTSNGRVLCRAAVWCCCASLCGSYVFSGSSDMTICRWLLPSSSCDTYGPYGKSSVFTDFYCASVVCGIDDDDDVFVFLPSYFALFLSVCWFLY